MLAATNWRRYADHYPSDHHTVIGNVLVLPQVWSPQLNNARDILVYLPPSYLAGARRYRVIYMQDGQNLFDRATSFAGVEWQVDETMEALSVEGLEAIVVGIPHMGDRRLAEYTPLSNSWWRGCGDQYAAFVCDTLKPLIDRSLRTLTGRASTGIFGSSMGALIGLYTFFERPDMFGRCGAMSPSLWVGRGVINQHLRPPQDGDRIYIDNGTREGSARPLVALLREKGYQDQDNLMYVVEEGGQHTEAAWARRLPNALRFLLKPEEVTSHV